jgi:hypothetical protein
LLKSPARRNRRPTTSQEKNVSVTQSLLRSRRTLAVAAGAVAVLSLAVPASAKEAAGVVTFAPSVAPTTGCNPIQSLKIDSDTNDGESGLASISVDYQVKACDSKQTLALETIVADYYDPRVVLWDDPVAPLSGKLTVYGVTIAKNYRVTLIVRDARTGTTVYKVDRLANVPRPTGV